MIDDRNKALMAAGFPKPHADAFLEVARWSGCAIMSRVPGVYAKGLISENYASKGFHIKAKSCDWGPMAGFVCRDPRFSKYGKTDAKRKKQQSYIDDAVAKGAQAIDLIITAERKKWLIDNELVKPLPNQKDIYQATLKDLEKSNKTLSGESDCIKEMQSMLFAFEEVEQKYSLLYRENTQDPRWKAIRALQDRVWNDDSGTSFVAFESWKKATTGDYDLFAIWPKNDANWQGNAQALNNRLVGAKALKDNNLANENPNLGNITGRIATIRWQLNEAIRTTGRYSGGDMVHHSDEAGRPFIDDVDLPFLVFMPDGKNKTYKKDWFLIESVEEFQALIEALKSSYTVALNPGWINQLGNKYSQYQIKGVEVTDDNIDY